MNSNRTLRPFRAQGDFFQFSRLKFLDVRMSLGLACFALTRQILTSYIGSYRRTVRISAALGMVAERPSKSGRKVRQR